MDIGNISRAAALMREAQSILGAGPLDFYLSEMAASYNMLMERYAPFRVGDRVVLKRAPNFEAAPGWECCKHFLKRGAKATVREASCGSRGFKFGIEFDAESWIDLDGRERPVSQKHLYHFGEPDLSPGDQERS